MVKKVCLSIFLVSNIYGFELTSLTSAVSDIAQKGLDTLTAKDAETIKVDRQCKKMFESYDINYKAALSLIANHAVSNSSSISGFLTGDNNSEEKTQEQFKQLSKKIAKESFWIPIQVEKFYGELTKENRENQNSIISRKTKNQKYKKLYVKIDKFLAEYKKDIKERNFPFDLKIFITTDEKHAESAPYGHIFISQDLIKGNYYKTILAHEISHVAKRHAVKELQYRLIKTYSSITDFTKLIKDINQDNFIDKIDKSEAMEIVQGAFDIYTNEQELEADACGLKTMIKIDNKHKELYTNEIIANIKNMPHTENTNDKNSHPSKTARIENIKELKATL